MNNTYSKALKRQTIFAFIAAFLTIGSFVTYALYNFDVIYLGKKENQISTCSFNISFKDENPINLVAAYPIADSEIDSFQPYTFYIDTKSNSCRNMSYEITMIDYCDSCPLSDNICTVKEGLTANCSSEYKISSSVINYQVKNTRTNEITTGSDPINNLSILGNITTGIKDTFELKLWIDEGATEEDLYVYENGSPKENADGSIVTKNFISKIKATTISTEPSLLPLTSPIISLSGTTIRWQDIPNTIGYTIYMDDVSIATNVKTTYYNIASAVGTDIEPHTFTVVANGDAENYLDSIKSNPIVYVNSVMLSTIPVGTTIMLNENGVPKEYIIVKKGYPVDTDGNILLLRKYIVAMTTESTYIYSGCNSDTYLTNTFYATLDEEAKNQIPSISPAGVSNKKVFLLSTTELGASWSTAVGTNTGYFTTNDSRIAYNESGTAVGWWTRSTSFTVTMVPDMQGGSYPLVNSYAMGYITTTGTASGAAGSSYGIRPALTMIGSTMMTKNADGSYKIFVQ